MSDSGTPATGPRDDRLRLFAFTTRGEARRVPVGAAGVRSRPGQLRGVAARGRDRRDPRPDRGRRPGRPARPAVEITPLLEQLHLGCARPQLGRHPGGDPRRVPQPALRLPVHRGRLPGLPRGRERAGGPARGRTLSRLALPDLLADLRALAAANRAADGDEVYRKLSRLDRALADMAERAARFYLMLGDLGRTTEITPRGRSSPTRTRCSTHLREFHAELQRYAPRLAGAIAASRRPAWTGWWRRPRPGRRAAVRRHSTERWSRLAARGGRGCAWFAPRGRPSEADRLREGTMARSATCSALLRRVTETRRGGVSRESQLRHLAAWFARRRRRTPRTRCSRPCSGSAGRATSMRAPRRRRRSRPARPGGRPRRWRCPARWSRSGRTPSPGRPAGWNATTRASRRLRERQLAGAARHAPPRRSRWPPVASRPGLDEAETEVLLRLLDVALAARVPVSGRVRPLAGAENGVTADAAPARRIDDGADRPRPAAPRPASGERASEGTRDRAARPRLLPARRPRHAAPITFHTALSGRNALPLVRRWAAELRDDLPEAVRLPAGGHRRPPGCSASTDRWTPRPRP